jgi:hypothetical protein
MLLAESLLGSSSSLEPVYIEDMFSTWLYTGNGSTQTITNGINLAGKGGLVWIKGRSAATDHALCDTARGATFDLASNTTAAQTTQAQGLTSFLANGFSIGSLAKINTNAATYASWTFRKQPKFFDVVTYTGNGANRTIAHSLNSAPGCIIVKRTDATADWYMYHRNVANTQYMVLNSTSRALTFNGANVWNSTSPTATEFSLGTDTAVNANGGTYVAYLFAHDAGGFGTTGTDNVITCGGYTGTGAAGNTITLGYEPQWLLIKRTDFSSDWSLADNMRGFLSGSSRWARLRPNLADAEADVATAARLTPTGFVIESTDSDFNSSGATYIYIAIRRGPMRTPTTGTSVFGLNARTGTGANATVTGGQTDDAVLIKNRGSAVASLFSSRLTGTGYLVTSSTAAEVAAGTTILQANPWDVMDGVKVGTTSTITNASGNTFINYLFRRAPGFFDVVCYTGTSNSNPQTLNHNLGVQPELIIVKNRGFNTDINSRWNVGSKYLPDSTPSLVLNTTAARSNATFLDSTWDASANANTITIGSGINLSGFDYVAYLFASCPGVSKVGSYTGTGATQVINCGFAAGARFVLIKRTDSTGDWYVWDSARGIVAGNDPYLRLNSTAAEVTNTDWVDTAASGFELSAAVGNLANTSGGSYIFLAIA